MYNKFMSYKVFLVEDEIVTREGIRDNVDWEAAGFRFCGEAPNGEAALPLIEEAKPDVLITDIKMPFMDGLQLSKIIRKMMPWVKIIILSGHDEFNFAQAAVKLGVTEYLLKPISARDLSKVLKELYKTLDAENQEREKLKSLQYKAEDNLVLSREKFLLKLVMGGISSADAVEQSRQLGLDIIAHYYLVIFIQVNLRDNSQPFDYYVYQQVEQVVSEFAGNNLDILLTKKGPEELVLLLKGDSLEQMVEEGSFLAGLIKKEVEKITTCNAVVELGQPQDRLGGIHHSFAEALVKSKVLNTKKQITPEKTEKISLIKINHAVIEDFLKFGSIYNFDNFFNENLLPLAHAALQSAAMKHYFFVDIMLAVTQFISDLGGEIENLPLDLQETENILPKFNNIEKIREEIKRIFSTALSFRSDQSSHERVVILQQARAFLEENFSDPKLKMSQIAERFNLSPGYFSTSFRQEFGETFQDYLGDLRIKHAKELLATTNLKCSVIAFQCGYNDAHYFSFVFKNKTGISPQQFRTQIQKK